MIVTSVVIMMKSLTYDELSKLLDIKIASARRLVMRKKWLKTKGNDGKTRISVPEHFLEDKDSRNDNHDDSHSGDHIDVVSENVMLKARIEDLERLVNSEKQRAASAELDRDRWHEIANKSWFKKLFE